MITALGERREQSTLGAVRKTVLSSSKSSLSRDDWDMLCCGISPAGMSIDAVEAKAEPACSGTTCATLLRTSLYQMPALNQLHTKSLLHWRTPHAVMCPFALNRLCYFDIISAKFRTN